MAPVAHHRLTLLVLLFGLTLGYLIIVFSMVGSLEERESKFQLYD